MLKYLFLFLVFFKISNSQEITSYVQFNGRYDYTAIGNTLNPAENNLNGSFCFPLTQSSAALNLASSNTVIAAYLFWAGSGNGDTNVTLNGTDFEADYTFNTNYAATSNNLTYFSCIKEITSFIIAKGNTTYTLSNLNISEALSNNPRYCRNRTNFAGWSIYIIYKNDTNTLNQVNLFVGLDIINRTKREKTIVLNNLNIRDNDNAKIGFLAWEGDNALNFGETLSINGHILSNPPLNRANNTFNGTNSFTGATNFYNADLDFYNIENNINPGDTEVEIKLTTGAFDNSGIFRADLIILNNIITVLNSQVPDASVILDNYNQNCNSNQIEIDYTVSNINSSELLPINTPIAFYADNILIGQSTTNQIIEIGESILNSITLPLPANITANYELTISVDDDGQGNGSVTEISELNNTSVTNQIALPNIEEFMINIEAACPTETNESVYNLIDAVSPFELNYLSFHFYESLSNLQTNQNEILNTLSYTTNTISSTVFVYAEKNLCYDIIKINLFAKNCPPLIPQGISPNNDGLNDVLKIKFLGLNPPNYDLQIFNRYGTLIFKGNQNNNWNGTANRGSNRNKPLPIGTYYFVLQVVKNKKTNYTGWIYLTK